MSTIQSLKKQLRGVRSTQKLTKAMKTISTVKFSKLSGIYNKYSEYGRCCEEIFEQYGASFADIIGEADSSAPVAVVVIASNKGLCGSFNSELLNFARDKLSGFDKFELIACGKKAIGYFKSKNILPCKEYVLGDIPSYEESALLLDDIIEWRKSGRVSNVYVIYPKYENMMLQKPSMIELFKASERDDSDSVLFLPDKATIVKKSAATVFRSAFYELVLESALGAQAATLMTMRSAYDTATQYCIDLEGQINRKRQSAVTADVIETSAEWGE